MQEKLTYFKAKYDELKSKPGMNNVFDEGVSAKIAEVAEYVGTTPIKDMTAYQLEDVYDMFKMVLAQIRNANKAFRQGKWEDLQAIASLAKEEIASSGKEKGQRTAIVTKLTTAMMNELKPVYFFEYLGSPTMKQLFKELRAGEDTWARDITEAKDFADSVRAKYGWDKWNLDELHKVKLESGRTVELTLRQLMSIYAYSRRPQATEHMMYGGFVFNNDESFKKITQEDGKTRRSLL